MVTDTSNFCCTRINNSQHTLNAIYATTWLSFIRAAL